jgi:hypothetical protein
MGGEAASRQRIRIYEGVYLIQDVIHEICYKDDGSITIHVSIVGYGKRYIIY